MNVSSLGGNMVGNSIKSSLFSKTGIIIQLMEKLTKVVYYVNICFLRIRAIIFNHGPHARVRLSMSRGGHHLLTLELGVGALGGALCQVA